MAKGGAAPAGGDAMAVDGAGPSHGPADAASAETDLFTRLKLLQRHIEFLDIQEEYIKDEQKNLKRELLRAQEEVKRIQSVPLVIGQFLEMVDTNTGIVGSTTGSNYYVRILSTLNRELLKPSASVALHRHSNALVDVLPPEADSSISLMSAAEKPDVSYAVRASRAQAAARRARNGPPEPALKQTLGSRLSPRRALSSPRLAPRAGHRRRRRAEAGDPRGGGASADAPRAVPPDWHRPAARRAPLRPARHRQDDAGQGGGAPHHRRFHPRRRL